MFKSMTGFGRAEKTIGKKTFLVDIKSLNGKQFDLSLRLPAILKPLEFDIRKTLANGLSRGSVECSVSLKETGDSKPVTINTDLAKAYYNSLAGLSEELGIDSSNILSALIKLPEVITPSSETLSEEEAGAFNELLKTAIDDLNGHRANEGVILEEEIKGRIRNIALLQKKVEELDPERKQMIRDGIVKLLEEKVGKDNFDANRLEQELIYYIEKIDITEEMVRLRNHCSYFMQIADENTNIKGKKLSFVLQEIGREINTTGSKAYNSNIQKLVVMMKDELEKAKEQILNVL